MLSSKNRDINNVLLHSPDGGSGYKAPLMETKVVQVYPSEYKEREAINLHEKCGWMLVSSNRQQERHGDTTSTFIRLTFQRDKNMPNYSKIKELSDLATSYIGTKANQGAMTFVGAILAVLGIIIALIIGRVLIALEFVAPGIITLIIGIGVFAAGVFLIVKGVLKAKHLKRMYDEGKQKAEQAANECETIIRNNG